MVSRKKNNGKKITRKKITETKYPICILIILNHLFFCTLLYNILFPYYTYFLIMFTLFKAHLGM